MIKFKKLKIKNFRSYKQLEWSAVNQMGLTLISGGNGAGKSTIRHAIEYLLLDKTSDNLAVDDLPLNGDTNCKLECLLEMPNKDEIRIVKYRNDSGMGNKIEVEINGDDSLTATDRRITKKNIDKLLGLTPELVFSSTIFSQNSPSFVECAEKDRKDILYNFINRDLYDRLLAKTKGRINEIEKLINEWRSNQNSGEVQRDELERQHCNLGDAEEEHKAKIDMEIESLRMERDDILFNDPSDIQEDIEYLLSQTADIPEDRLQEYLKDKERLEEKLSLHQANEKKVYAAVKEAKSKLTASQGGRCPLLDIDCDSLIKKSEFLKTEYQPQVEYFESELSKVIEKIAKIREQIIIVDDKLATIEEQKNSQIKLSNEIRYLKDKLEDMRHHNSQIDTMKSNINERIDKLKVDRETNKFKDLRVNIEDKLEELKYELINMKAYIKQLRKEYEYLRYWETGFSRSGIPNMKMEAVLESLESETNEYLSRISDSIFVEIDAQAELKSGGVSEKISYLVHHPDKHIKNYTSYSGGERQRVKLSDIFAFNTLLGKFDIMILDEVLEGSIDDRGKSQIIALLKEKSKELGSLFVVSHDDYIKDSFDKVIYAIKEDGISRMVKKI